MKLPKYGIWAAAAIAIMYVLYIIYSLATGGKLNGGEIAMAVTFVVCIGAVIVFEYKHKDDDKSNDDNL